MPVKQDKQQGGAADARKQRAAEQLRRNLMLRKAQSRSRAAAVKDGETGAGDDPQAGRER
ncbi:MAG: hypothetical protein H6891_00750 [Brucellaceae bacterium]|nr:hypothetical protein [Brucellaceae bacterium]